MVNRGAIRRKKLKMLRQTCLGRCRAIAIYWGQLDGQNDRAEWGMQLKKRLATAAAAALVTAALVAAPAYAQLGGGGTDDGKTRYSEEEKRAEAARERAYRDAIKNTRGASNEAYDPWRTIRPGAPEKKSQR